MKTASVFAGLVIALVADSKLIAADEPTAQNSFTVKLPPPAAPTALLADSPFGINTAFNPDSPDLEARLKAMQQAGIKWGLRSIRIGRQILHTPLHSRTDIRKTAARQLGRLGPLARAATSAQIELASGPR